MSTVTAPPPQSKLSVLSIRRGRIPQPRRDLIHGPPGVGKTTFAASYPDVVFMATEDGTSEMDVARFPRPASWVEVLQILDSLDKDAHDFKTLAVDTIDWLEPVVWAEVCRAGGKADIEAFGYGKGYLAAVDLWRQFLGRLEQLQLHRNMSVVLIAHSQTKKFENPLGDPYDRYILKLNEKAAGLLREWSSFVGFATYETVASKVNKTHIVGLSTGARVLHTVYNAAWDAKNRENLPATLPFSYWEFVAAVVTRAPAEVAKMQALIKELLPKLAEDKKAGVVSWLNEKDNATNAVALARAVDRINGLIALAEPAADAAPQVEGPKAGEQGTAT